MIRRPVLFLAGVAIGVAVGWRLANPGGDLTAMLRASLDEDRRERDRKWTA